MKNVFYKLHKLPRDSVKFGALITGEYLELQYEYSTDREK